MKNILKKLSVMLLFALVGCSSGGGLLDGPVTMDQNASIVGTKGITYEFSATEPLDEEIAVIQKDNKIASQLKAFTIGIHALNPEDYQTFKDIQSSGRCPASFLNKSDFLYLVGTDKVSVANKLKDCNEGDVLQLKGYFVDVDMSKEGMDLAPLNKSGNIQYVYVDSVSKK